MEKIFWVAFIAFFILFVAFIVFQKYLAAFVLLLVVGFAFQKLFNLDGFLFFYLLKSKLGIKQMEEFSKKEIFSKICDIGFFVSFGLSSLILKKQKKLDVVAGMLILLLLYLSFPFYSLSFIRIFSSSIPVSSLPKVESNLVSLIILLSFFSFGVFGLTFLSFLINSYLIFQMSAQGEKPIPGVMPVIPGLNIPLLSGILSLFIAFSLHEFAHGVISISKKVKVKSTGLLLVGVLPIGAFVENDEKKMERIKKVKQNQILIAGVTANFLLSLLFLPLLLYLQNIKIESYVVVVEPVNSSLAKGDVILKFGNFSINSFDDLKSAEGYYFSKNISNIQLTIKNSSAVFTKIITTKSGKIGAYFSEEPKDKVVSFFVSFVELSFVLNFILGASNLLPIPGFDGHKLLKNILGKYSKILEYATILLFLINLLPFISL
jgi:Zn-dependent protease